MPAATPATGLGIDVIEIERIERALERRPRLRERLFTASELAYADQRARPGRHLAARFAAKEAVIKALAGARVTPSEIEIEIVAGEPPTVRLHGRAAEAAGGREVSVSLTHSRDTAAAVALAS
ncbi:MAG: holo-ACP synthase [Actinomycetota bacterium]|nr:holo-ACP synthase [Actinomycetota bacterium]